MSAKCNRSQIADSIDIDIFSWMINEDFVQVWEYLAFFYLGLFEYVYGKWIGWGRCSLYFKALNARKKFKLLSQTK